MWFKSIFSRKDNITINNNTQEKSDAFDLVIKELIDVVKELKFNVKEINQNLYIFREELSNLTKAFKIYVENNGVKEEVKNIVRELLE